MIGHFDASPYSRLAIFDRLSPATTVYMRAVVSPSTRGDGAVLELPVRTSSKRGALVAGRAGSLRFGVFSSLSKMLSNSPIVPPGHGDQPSGGGRKHTGVS